MLSEGHSLRVRPRNSADRALLKTKLRRAHPAPICLLHLLLAGLLRTKRTEHPGQGVRPGLTALPPCHAKPGQGASGAAALRPSPWLSPPCSLPAPNHKRGGLQGAPSCCRDRPEAGLRAERGRAAHLSVSPQPTEPPCLTLASYPAPGTSKGLVTSPRAPSCGVGRWGRVAPWTRRLTQVPLCTFCSL